MRLIDIDDANEHFVDDVFAGERAQYWVHYNRYWLDNSRTHDDVDAYLIAVDDIDDPVGFVAFGRHYRNEELTESVPATYEVIHLVIDEAQQRRGFGRAATELAIERLAAIDDCEQIVIAHHPDNVAAQRLYESMGFTAVGENYDGDPLLRLDTATRTTGGRR